MADAKITADLELKALNKTGPGIKGVTRDLDGLAKHVDRVNRKLKEVDRTQRAVHRSEKQRQQYARVERGLAHTRSGAIHGVIGPGKLAAAGALYGAGRAYMGFADVERELTRIGNKAGATRQQMQAVRREIEVTADKWAMPLGDVTATFDSLIESGFEFEEARARLDDMVKVTQALGGTGAETVGTWDALRKSIGATGDEARAYFDTIAAGSAAGKFEARDLASYLPSLLPVAARQGIDTLPEFQGLVGVLEALRDVSGDSSQTVTAMNDFLEKITSPDVVKNFKKAGKDIFSELDRASEAGEDLWETMHRLLREVTGGDARRLGEIFGDKEARRAANLILTDIARIRKAIADVRANSKGMIDANVNNVLDDAKAKLDRMTSSLDRFGTNLGANISIVATPLLDRANKAMSQNMAIEAGYQKLMTDDRGRADILTSFREKYLRDHPDTPAWQLVDPSQTGPFFEAFNAGLAAVGRGEVASPYEFIQRANNARMPIAQQYREYEKGQIAAGRRTIDGLPVNHGGVPLPTPRAEIVRRQAELADMRRQYGEYGAGRLAMREAVLQREDDWSGWSTGAPVQIPDRSAPGSGGWRGGSFEPDALRKAIEEGSRSIEKGGDEAGAAIDQAGQNLPTLGEKAGAALGRAVMGALSGQMGTLGAQIAAGFNANVRVPNGGGSLPRANKAPGRTMPDAGQPGG